MFGKLSISDLETTTMGYFYHPSIPIVSYSNALSAPSQKSGVPPPPVPSARNFSNLGFVDATSGGHVKVPLHTPNVYIRHRHASF